MCKHKFGIAKITEDKPDVTFADTELYPEDNIDETMVDDVPAELDCRGHDENVIPFMDALLS